MPTFITREDLLKEIEDLWKMKVEKLANPQKKSRILSSHFKIFTFMSFVVYTAYRRTRYLQNRCSLIR